MTSSTQYLDCSLCYQSAFEKELFIISSKHRFIRYGVASKPATKFFFS